MLRLSRCALFIVPNSTSPELPLFLSTKEKHTTPAVGDVYQRVMAFDRRGADSLSGGATAKGDSVAQAYFSGSAMGAAATAAGVGLFVLTFAYNVGKPVVDAHREYFSRLALQGESADADGDGEAQNAVEEKEDDGGVPSPMEEFDDAVVEEGEGGE